MLRTRLFSTTSLMLMGLALGPAWLPQSAGAQTTAAPASSTLDVVIVTARRRVENIQSVPVAVTALSNEKFQSTGVFSALQMSSLTAGLHVDTLGIGDRNDLVFSIRGQGQTYGTEYPSVITYFAGIPVARLTTGQFFDLQNVQVLRGPQGTLFGKVTDGGAVLIEPAKPKDDFEGYIQGKFGNYGLNAYSGAINVPIVKDKVLFRAAFDIDRRDGYTTDRGLPATLNGVPPALLGASDPNKGRTYDNVDYNSFRFGLLVRPVDGLENYTVFSYYDAYENGTSNQLVAVTPSSLGAVGLGALTTYLQAAAAQNVAAGPRSVALSAPLESNRTNAILSNTTTYSFTNGITLKNIFGYVYNKENTTSDFDGTVFALIDTGSPRGVPLYYSEQFSDELQLQGKAFDDKLNWTAGLYYDYMDPPGLRENLVTELLQLQRTQIERNIDQSEAAYAQGTYDLSNWVRGLKFTAGIRYTEQQNQSTTNEALEITAAAPMAICSITKTPGGALALGGNTPYIANYSQCAFAFKSSENAVTWNVDLDYQATRNTLLYVASRRGFKGGGFNATYSALSQAPYGPEYIQDVELGVKSDWNLAGMKGRTNAALFRADETGIQRLVTFTDSSGSPDSYISNAADAVVQGLELEGTLIPVNGVTIGLKYAYTDASYDRKNAAAACSTTTTVPSFCPLNHFQNTPQNQVTVDAHYRLPLDPSQGVVSFGGSYTWQSAVALTDDSYVSANAAGGNPAYATEAAYGLLNLDATWTNVMGHPIDLSLFATNVTDKVYRVGVSDLSYDFGVVSNVYGEPRMVGGSIKYHFGPSH